MIDDRQESAGQNYWKVLDYLAEQASLSGREHMLNEAIRDVGERLSSEALQDLQGEELTRIVDNICWEFFS